MDLTAFFIEIIVIFILVILNGLFAMSEIALVSARKFRLKQLSDKGKRVALMPCSYATNPPGFYPRYKSAYP